MVFDARFLRNPHYEDDLQPLTGLDAPVAAYVRSDPDYTPFFESILGLLTVVLPRFVGEGKKYATLAVGCTGGRHRSVTLVEALARSLPEANPVASFMTLHRELAGTDAVPHTEAAAMTSLRNVAP